MSEVLVLQHAAPEGPAAIGDALKRRGVGMKIVRIDQGAAVPGSMDGVSGLVVMGGPMSAYDPIPHVAAEVRLIGQALEDGVPVLGVCLGSQLLAAALGARVYPSGRKEIGWHEVRLGREAGKDGLWRGVEEHFMGFHWHGDVFDLPRGAVPLASSPLTELQAYRAGDRAYGLLFHLEVGEAQIRGFVSAFAEELAAAQLPPAPILDGIPLYLKALQRIGAHVFDRWAALLDDHK